MSDVFITRRGKELENEPFALTLDNPAVRLRRLPLGGNTYNH